MNVRRPVEVVFRNVFLLARHVPLADFNEHPGARLSLFRGGRVAVNVRRLFEVCSGGLRLVLCRLITPRLLCCRLPVSIPDLEQHRGLLVGLRLVADGVVDARRPVEELFRGVGLLPIQVILPGQGQHRSHLLAPFLDRLPVVGRLLDEFLVDSRRPVEVIGGLRPDVGAADELRPLGRLVRLRVEAAADFNQH